MSLGEGTRPFGDTLRVFRDKTGLSGIWLGSFGDVLGPSEYGARSFWHIVTSLLDHAKAALSCVLFVG